MDNLVALFPIVLSLISVLLTIYVSIQKNRDQRKMLNILKKENFEKVIQSSDINLLGKYLDDEIGQLTISDYVENKDINTRTNDLIKKLIAFIGTEDQIEKEQIQQGEPR